MTTSLPTISSLTPYSGEWGREQAAHLLRRATFSPTASEIDDAIALGLSATIDQLFIASPLPDPPVYYDFAPHQSASLGDSWVDLEIQAGANSADRDARLRSYEAWMVLSTAASGFRVREKMLFFWVNHFGVGYEGETDPRALYRYVTKLRAFSTGDFRQLLKDVTLLPTMLKFLNGDTNTAANPNENFAREILELFTLGKGPQVGPGDYTTYTELDVTELAKCFTGWKNRFFDTQIPGREAQSYYVNPDHDASTKVLSERFNFREIPNTANNEYADVIDIILERDEVATYLVTKLYRHFVDYEISTEAETAIIAPLAQILIDANYHIEPVLRTLFESEHFFEVSTRGNIIKSPLEFVHSILRPVGLYEQADFIDNYRIARYAFLHARETGMNLRHPPTVAGWTAYYQAPNFYRLWLSVASIQERTAFLRNASLDAFTVNGTAVSIDWLGFIENFTNPTDPNGMILEFTEQFLPQPALPEQLTELKALLLPGLDDFVWSGEYSDYLSNPFDDSLRMAVSSRLKRMLFGLFQLAEFQLT